MWNLGSFLEDLKLHCVLKDEYLKELRPCQKKTAHVWFTLIQSKIEHQDHCFLLHLYITFVSDANIIVYNLPVF